MSATVIRAPAPAVAQLAGIGWGMAAAVIWGAYLAFARAGVTGGLAPLDLALLRYGTAGLFALPFLGWWTLGGVGWRRGLLLTLLAGPAFILGCQKRPLIMRGLCIYNAYASRKGNVAYRAQ